MQTTHKAIPTAGAETKVVTKALLRAATMLDVPNVVLARVIGVSDATVSRLRNHGGTLPSRDKSFELAILFIRMFRSLDSLIGGDAQVARAWLRAPNDAIAGMPIDTIQTIQGLVNVIAYLDARRAVV